MLEDEEETMDSVLECREGGRHVFDQMDMDGSVEYGHCIKCGDWIDTRTGENETESFERRME